MSSITSEELRKNPVYGSSQLTAMQTSSEGGPEDFQVLLHEVGTSITRYCKNRPTAAAGALFAVGFFVGWKIKPW